MRPQLAGVANMTATYVNEYYLAAVHEPTIRAVVSASFIT